MRVFVYFNLHRKCWSIKALEGSQRGRVVAHAKRVNLADATFKVSEAGRQRVLLEKRKNVHAGVVGHWDGHCDASAPTWPTVEPVGVTYNPYQAATFVRRDNREPVRKAQAVHLADRAALAYLVGA